MYIYNVTVSLEPSVEREWLSWMQDEHIPEVMATGMFIDYKMLKLLTEVDGQGITYAIQYSFDDMTKYHKYQNEFAPALQAAHAARFKDKFVAFRTVLELV